MKDYAWDYFSNRYRLMKRTIRFILTAILVIPSTVGITYLTREVYDAARNSDGACDDALLGLHVPDSISGLCCRKMQWEREFYLNRCSANEVLEALQTYLEKQVTFQRG